MDPIIDKEIQNLIDDNIGDTKRLEFIQHSLRTEKKIFNSDLKYLMHLLHENSKDENILERLDYLQPKSKKPTHLYKNQKFCIVCEKSVLPKREFSTGALLALLVLGIVPGLIYYGIKNKKCPICKNSKWKVLPEKRK